ncbi:DUF262 domain-containing protein [Brevundimonas goettingensis]|uniref:DUF262 domain-containing protein n=1 Tax=Brevundimonas goettingensis TaxID=2774190 RepID=A0A975BYU1_9CAUL|nr:DUF262 domain-containing protein [Brevundimonas goettingensis]QTC90223.1 DUF262 domain-containing protein [Brevundimonas goettingensis]
MSYVETSPLKNSTVMMLHADRDEIETNPPYQRAGGVWTLEKKRLLIDSIINDYDIPKLYFHQYDSSRIHATGKRYAIIDGRQRLETIWEFMDGGFSLGDDTEYQRDISIDLKNLGYADIAVNYPKIRIKFDSFVLPIVLVSTQGDEDDLIEDMFSRLNEAVPLNAAEKRNAIGGEMVEIINRICREPFFTHKLRISNRRYQHKEAAARFLLVEENIQKNGRLIDTKRVYLDALVKNNKSPSDTTASLETSVQSIVVAMSNVFMDRDELLSAQGNLVIYYLIFRGAEQFNELGLVNRRALLDFRTALVDNRNRAENDYEGASFEMLEYDRLSQQGTNDASSIRERYGILARYLGLTKQDFEPGRANTAH